MASGAARNHSDSPARLPGPGGREPAVLAPAPRTILVVDDEPAITDSIAYTLRKEGYRVEIAATGPEGIAAARRLRPDAIVLDVMLPGVDGLQVCRTLRAESTVPILLLSAKGEEIDRVVGLELGADDYLGKPFAMRELLARVRAMLRRVQMMGGSPETAPIAVAEPPAPEPAEDQVRAGDLAVNRARREATIGTQPLSLRPKEFDLLFFLASHPNVVHSRKVLLQRVWGYDFPIDTRTVDVHVRWLRQKIEQDPQNPTRIETVRGFGYRLIVDDGPPT
ncbi:MAG: response regulator transcription factor [Thermomicrobiales bacterium]|nr:response regulator transcription factor [Thermomicrobiales bacterium]